MKKQNLKNDKGITLIVLVITIVALLILTTVSINLVINRGIISHAENAVENYNQVAVNELEIISDYETLIENIINPSKAEPNFWQKKGLTSKDVKFDTLYKGTINLSGTNEVMHFGFYSNGDICVNFSETDITISTKDEDGNNNTGNNGGDRQFVEIYEGLFKISTNTITLPLNRVGDDYMTIRYIPNNTAEVYYGESSDFDENGHIPESDDYHKGTLVEQ